MKKSLICIILTLSTLFIGCNSSSQTKKDKVNGDATKELLQMKHYKKDINGVVFDTDIIINNRETITENSFVKPTASVVLSDGDKLIQTFFKDKKIEKKTTDSYTNRVGKQDVSTNIFGPNKSILYFNSKSSFDVQFRNNNFVDYIKSAFYNDLQSPDYNAHKYSLIENLPFATRENAFKDISSIMASVGFDIGTNYKAYALDHETLKKEESVLSIDGSDDLASHKASWSVDDDCYYFCINPTFNNIPTMYKFSNSNVSGYELQSFMSPIQVVYTKAGIQFFYIDGIFNLTSTGEKLTLAPFDTIAKRAAKRYSNLLGSNTYKITKASLVYRIDTTKSTDSYPVTLAWGLNVEESHSDNSQISNKEIIVDAVTGREILDGK